MWEAISIILALGLLEYILWRIDHRELKEQTTLLEEISKASVILRRQVALQYLAGIIDGEAFVGISRRAPKEGTSKRSIQYFEQIKVGMMDEEAIILLHKEFGGCFGRQMRGEKTIFHWTVTARKACETIRILLPFLRVKTEQARILLLFREGGHFGGRGKAMVPKAELARRESLWRACKQLNRNSAVLRLAGDESEVTEDNNEIAEFKTNEEKTIEELNHGVTGRK